MRVGGGGLEIQREHPKIWINYVAVQPTARGDRYKKLLQNLVLMPIILKQNNVNRIVKFLEVCKAIQKCFNVS